MAKISKKNRFDYFDAFIAQAEVAQREAHALVEAMSDFHPDDEAWVAATIGNMHELEKEGDVVCHQILDKLAVEFMPPIDREDVTELAMLLDDVTDLVEEVVQHAYMYNIRELHPHALPVARVIEEAVDALAEATQAFREFKKPKKLDRLLVAVHDKESEGDKLYIEAKRDVFTGHAGEPATYFIAWNSMFSHMEQCCDACERVASVMQKIALKNG